MHGKLLQKGPKSGNAIDSSDSSELWLRHFTPSGPTYLRQPQRMLNRSMPLGRWVGSRAFNGGLAWASQVADRRHHAPEYGVPRTR